MEPNPALSVIIAIIIAILTTSFLFSVGYAVFEQPQYSDYCTNAPYKANMTDAQVSQQQAEQQRCSDTYNAARDRVDNALFYIVSILGVLLLIVALVLNPGVVNLRFYLLAGVIFGSLAAILISTMMNWSSLSRFVRPFVLLVEIAIVMVTAYRLFAGTKGPKKNR